MKLSAYIRRLGALLSVLLLSCLLLGCGAQGGGRAGELSEEELDWFNTEFFDDMTGMANLMLSSEYEDVSGIDLYQLFYNGVPGGQEVSQEEKEALEALDSTAGSLDVTRVTAGEMEEVLQTYGGLGLEDTQGVGMDQFLYLEDYDAYYLIHSDVMAVPCQVSSGTRNEDGTVTLQYENEILSGQYAVTLRETEEGYQFVSNLPAD